MLFQKGAMLVLILMCGQAHADSPSPLQPLYPLLGEWRGVGEGKWGRSSAEAAYSVVLGGHFIEGRLRSVYPSQSANPNGETHRARDVFSYDQARQRLVLRQFDNEGFVTTYYQNVSAGNATRLVFEAEHLENIPTGWGARMTFEFMENRERTVSFDLDTGSGRGFERYLVNQLVRIDKAAGES